MEPVRSIPQARADAPAIQDRVASLRRHIMEVDQISDEVWIESLSERKLKEIDFHDAHRDRAQEATQGSDTYDKFYGNKKYYAGTQTSRNYTSQWIARHAAGKVFLDYACGDGVSAISAAKAGAALVLGLDISPVSVRNARSDAAKEGVGESTLFFQADCENTKLPDSSVDTILCSGMLHHLDLSYTFPELRRILRPGGRILAVEALDYNPAIKLYRYMTPDMRTDWEKAHILSLKDVRFAERFFDLGEIRYWHILGIAAPHLGPLAPLAHGLDAVLTKVPLVQRMAWIFTFELIKPEAN